MLRVLRAASCRRLYFRGFADTADDSPQYVYGTVKNYLRNKQFGFVTPDGGGADIYVHRTGIKSVEKMPPLSPVSHPYLFRGERIRFVVEEDGPAGCDMDGNIRTRAAQVEYEDGSQIPVYREKYVDNVAKYEKAMLGEAVFEVFEASYMDEDTKHQKVQEAYKKAKNSIQDAQKRKDDLDALV